MAHTDDGVVRIIANDLEYIKRLNTVDVLFAYFVDIRKIEQKGIKSEFHILIGDLLKLGELATNWFTQDIILGETFMAMKV